MTKLERELLIELAKAMCAAHPEPTAFGPPDPCFMVRLLLPDVEALADAEAAADSENKGEA